MKNKLDEHQRQTIKSYVKPLVYRFDYDDGR